MTTPKRIIFARAGLLSMIVILVTWTATAVFASADMEAPPSGAPNPKSADPTPGNPPEIGEDVDPSGENDPENIGHTDDPADLLTGNRWFRATDFVIPTPGIPLTFQRQYNSAEMAYEGPLGKGWFHSLDWRLSEAIEVIEDVFIFRDPSHVTLVHVGDGLVEQQPTPLPHPSAMNAVLTLSDDTQMDYSFAYKFQDRQLMVINTNSDIRVNGLYYSGAVTREPPPLRIRMGYTLQEHGMNGMVLPLPVNSVILDSVIKSVDVPVPFTTEMQISTNRWLEVYSGDGRRTRLHGQGGNFVSQDSPWHIYPEDDYYVLVTGEGVERVFSQDGRLRAIRDYAGNQIDLTYSGPLVSAEHSNGLTMDFTHESGRLTGVKVSEDLAVAFSYNAQHQLASVVRTVNGHSVTSRYEYAQGFLTHNINALGQTAEYFYESKNGSLTHRSTGMHFEEDWIPEQIEYTGEHTRQVVYPARDRNPLFEYEFEQSTRVLRHRHGPGVDAEDAARRGLRLYYTGDPTRTWTPILTERQYFDDDVGESFSEFTERDSSRLPAAISVAYGDRDNPVPLGTMEWDSHSHQLKEISDPAGGRIRIDYEDHLPVRIRAFYSESDSHTTHFIHTDGLLTAIEDARGAITGFAYDASGYTRSVVPPAGPAIRMLNSAYGFPVEMEILPEGSTNGTGRVYGFSRNARGRINAMTLPDARSVSMQYDALDRITRLTDAAGRHTDTTYTPLGRIASITRYLDPAPGTSSSTPVRVSINYDKWLNALEISEPAGRYVETYQLDLQDRPVEITNIEGQTMSIDYGLLHIVRSVTRFDGSTISNTYDNAGRLTGTTFIHGGDTRTLSMSYAPDSRLTGIADENVGISLSYDLLGQATNVVQSGTGILPVDSAYAYDPVGSLTNLAVAIGGVPVLARQYQYDAARRLVSLTQSGTGVPPVVFGYTYAPENGLVSRVENLDTGIAAAYAFDIMDRITDIAWQADGGNTLRGFAMDYDNADMITNLVHANGERRVYAYDSIDRLIGEEHMTASDTLLYSAAYEYDLAGNRTQTVINGVTNTYTLGLGNRLAAWGVNAENAQTYDTAGNVTQITDASGTRELSWDIQYRLTGVAVDGAPVETYGYDPLGRRAWTSDGSVTNWHVYDGMHCVADVDHDGTVLRSYTYGPGIDNLLALTVHGATETNIYFAITDHLGTVHGLADDTGAIVESYRYDAWGNILEVRDADGLLSKVNGLWSSPLGNRFLFQGREYSWATGLYNFRARWYDPVTGRWLSKDPIGISGGLNQYVAFANNPVMFIDPLGLSEEDAGYWRGVNRRMSKTSERLTFRLNVNPKPYQDLAQSFVSVLDPVDEAGQKFTIIFQTYLLPYAEDWGQRLTYSVDSYVGSTPRWRLVLDAVILPKKGPFVWLMTHGTGIPSIPHVTTVQPVK